MSNAAPLNWKSESVVAQAVREGAELVQNIRPIRTSQPNSRRTTLEKSSSGSRRSSTVKPLSDIANQLNSTPAKAQHNNNSSIITPIAEHTPPPHISTSKPSTPIHNSIQSSSKPSTPVKSTEQMTPNKSRPTTPNGTDSKHDTIHGINGLEMNDDHNEHNQSNVHEQPNEIIIH